MARPARFERATAWFVARYSIQLSYGRVLISEAGLSRCCEYVSINGEENLERDSLGTSMYLALRATCGRAIWLSCQIVEPSSFRVQYPALTQNNYEKGSMKRTLFYSYMAEREVVPHFPVLSRHLHIHVHWDSHFVSIHRGFE